MEIKWRFDDMCKDGENCKKESCWKCQYPQEYADNAYDIVSGSSDDDFLRCDICGEYNCIEDDCNKYLDPTYFNKLTNDINNAFGITSQDEKKNPYEFKPKEEVKKKRMKYRLLYEFGIGICNKRK
jgi:hypothetical protein